MEDGKRDIPYRIYGGLSFIKVKKLKTFCVICVWLSIQRRRSIRVINYPARGIGDTNSRKLTVAAKPLQAFYFLSNGTY
jgi:DNA helicase-2/ATP-dependent DNA helicase PcrA